MFRQGFIPSLGALALLAAGPAGAVTAPGYSFTVIDRFEGNGIANGQSYSINNQGQIARQRTTVREDGNAFDAVGNILVTNIDGVTTTAASTAPGFAGPFSFRTPIINDSGQFLTIRPAPFDNPTGEQLIRVNADGSITVLATRSSDPNTQLAPDFSEFDMSRAAINTAGEVAALVTTLDGRRQVVRFAADGSGHAVLAEETQVFFTFEGVDINASGQVAFIATEFGSDDPRFATTRSVYVADEARATRALTAPAGSAVGGRPTINDAGDVLAQGSLGNGGAIYFGAAGDGSDAAVILDQAPSVQDFVSVNLNNFGQLAALEARALIIDGQRIVGAGDEIAGVRGVVGGPPGSTGPVGLRENFGFNDLGQAVIEVQSRFVDEDGFTRDNFTILRVDPLGATAANPLLPFASTPEGENDVALSIANGLGVIAPIFVDPVVATGFTYTQGEGGANFASLLIPDALPLGDDEFLIEFLAGGSLFSETLFVGQTLDFTAFDPLGILSFSILGIDIAEGVDPTDPFVVGLTFVSGGFSSVLSIDAITVDTDAAVVPLPPALPLLGAAIFALFSLRRHRNA